MEPKKKISLAYLIFILAFAGLGLFIYALMNNIEAATTHLEIKLHRRNLGDIVDKNYETQKMEYSTETIPFLNSLTDFFDDFHENTTEYKKKLEEFMDKRKKVLTRLEKSNINVYNLSVLPNSDIPHYEMFDKIEEEDDEDDSEKIITNTGKNIKAQTKIEGQSTFSNKKFIDLKGEERSNIEDISEMSNYKQHKISRQFPFSRHLKFNTRIMKQKNSKMYLICSARISLTVKNQARFYASITESREKFSKENFMKFKPNANGKYIFNLNRVIFFEDLPSANIVIQGYSASPMLVDKVEAYCLNFDD
jgi:hypothetical protein